MIFLDYFDGILELSAVLIALSFCLFRYINHKSRGLVYAIAFFLLSLAGAYYWTVYTWVIHETPNVSDLFYYFACNIGYAVLLLLILHIRERGDIRTFHPLMLLPIPVNIWQLILYLPYGGELNSIYQVSILTVVEILCIQSICLHFRKKERERKFLFVHLSVLVYALLSFAMWTFTCFDYPVYYLFYPSSILLSLTHLFIAFAVGVAFLPKDAAQEMLIDRRYAKTLKAFYLAAMVFFTLGGLFLGLWMRDTMRADVNPSVHSGLYDIITVVLFIISVFLIVLVVVIIFMVNLMEKSVENNKLREARKVADRSNEAKSEFLANMSHEIRTPINAIMGMNEIILHESMRAEMKYKEDASLGSVFGEITNYAGNVDSAGKSLLAIINDILDFSKIEAGKLEIVKDEYTFASVLNDVSNMISFRAKAKDLDFQIAVDNAIPNGLYGDELRLRQIMTNLLNNAVKYTDKGSVKLSVTCDPKEGIKTGDTIALTIEVSDTGIGIKKEDLGSLFSKFERVDLKHNSTVEGTGLGLAITKELLNLMDGSVSVKSTYGEGSTFTAVLPQQVVSTESVGDFKMKFEQSLHKETESDEELYAPDAHILIVDDTAVNLTVAKGLLKKTGMQIDTATSGQEAVKLAEMTKYDVILMDQRMPEMDGTHALHLIRAQEDGLNADTPVICLTADAIGGAKEKYIAEGFTDYLTKPIKGSALKSALLKYLPKRQ